MLSLRTLLRHPLQLALMTFGIALGVAVMVSIDLANASAARAFDLSASAVAGRATHQILGSGQGVDEAFYVRLRTDPTWRARLQSAPAISTYAVSEQLGGIPFTLLGIDPFAEGPFRGYLGAQQVDLQATAPLLTVPGAVLLARPTAERYGLTPCPNGVPQPACHLQLLVNGQAHNAYLTGLLEPADDFARRALETLLLTDIASAQTFTGTPEQLTRIDLILPDEQAASQLEAQLPPGTLLAASATRSSQVAEMTAAFQVNLTALSLLALVVGLFLIYNTMTFSVVQRRPLFGTLRSLGFTREQVFGMVLGEAALVGALGSALGLVLGVLLGQGAVQMVTQTINDLFFVVSVRGIQVPAASLLKGGLAGLLASLLAAAPPAWEAAAVPPRLAQMRAGLETKARSAVSLAAVLGALAALLGAAALAVPTRSLAVSFGGTFAVTTGLAALTPLVTVTLMRLLGRPLERAFGLLGRLAPRNVIRSQSRTAVAAAALMVAVAVTIGVQVMIASFRTTVTLWLEQTLRGDIYLSAQDLSATRLETPLDPQVPALAGAHPLVQNVSAVRILTAESAYGPVDLVAASSEPPLDARLFLQTTGGPDASRRMLKDGGVLLSETLVNRLGLPAPGAALRLLTPRGWQDFPVAGVFADYASTRGSVRIDLDVYRRLWGDPRLNGLALFLKPGADPDAVLDDLRTRLRAFPRLKVDPSGGLRREALAVFDRTFAITTAMQLVTTLVAFIGVLSSLLALQLEKARELGILRALGLTSGEMRRLTLWETGLLGVSAGLAAMPTGYALAWILVYIINQRSFGWTLHMQVEPLPFVQAFLLAVAAALLAAVYPAWKFSRMQAAQALRGE